MGRLCVQNALLVSCRRAGGGGTGRWGARVVDEGLAIGAEGETVGEHDSERGGLVRRWDLEGGVSSGALDADLGDSGVADVAYTADGARVVAAMDREKVVVWAAGSGERLAVHTLPPAVRTDSVYPLATSPAGRQAAVGRDRIVDVLDLDTGAALRRTRVLGLPLALAWSPTGTLLVGMRGGALRTV